MSCYYYFNITCMFKYCILIDKSYFLIYNSYMYIPKKSTEYLWEYQFVLGKYSNISSKRNVLSD